MHLSFKPKAGSTKKALMRLLTDEHPCMHIARKRKYFGTQKPSHTLQKTQLNTGGNEEDNDEDPW